MSTLKFPLKPLDSIMDKMKKDVIYTVLHEDLHDVWVWIEGEAPKQMPKRMINMAYIKVNPKVVKVLYGEKDNSDADTINESAEQSES